MKIPYRIHAFRRWLEARFFSPEMDDVLRARLSTALLGETIGLIFLLIWAALNYALGFQQLSILNLVTFVLLLGNLAAYALDKKPRRHLHITIGLISAQFIGVHIFLGGFVASGYAAIWWFIPVLIAVFTFGFRDALPWLIFLGGLLAAGAYFEPTLARSAQRIDPAYVLAAGVFNLLLMGCFVIALVLYLVRRLDQEQQRADALLQNILPEPIAARLKRKPGTIARRYSEASILFADIVDFTPLTASMEVHELVGFLNSIYSHFDGLVEKHGLEKIRTIGDNYMVASGVPQPRPDHAQALARMALDMLAFQPPQAAAGRRVRFRMGINSGPLVAGVIGEKKFHYDVWGDTVNTASRMESHGRPGKIQVSETTYRLLEHDFLFESRGAIEVKGKGRMQTWFLLRPA